jgi:hypothetical protein
MIIVRPVGLGAPPASIDLIIGHREGHVLLRPGWTFVKMTYLPEARCSDPAVAGGPRMGYKMVRGTHLVKRAIWHAEGENRLHDRAG